MPNKTDIEYIKKEYNKIRNLFLAGQYQDVVTKTKVLLKKDPSQATFFNDIALSYNSLRQIDIAKSLWSHRDDSNFEYCLTGKNKNHSLLLKDSCDASTFHRSRC